MTCASTIYVPTRPINLASHPTTSLALRQSQVDPYGSERGSVQKLCGPNELLWNLEFRTDEYGYETSWKLERQRDVNGNDNAYVPVALEPPGLMKYADDTT